MHAKTDFFSKHLNFYHRQKFCIKEYCRTYNSHFVIGFEGDGALITVISGVGSISGESPHVTLIFPCPLSKINRHI